MLCIKLTSCVFKPSFTNDSDPRNNPSTAKMKFCAGVAVLTIYNVAAVVGLVVVAVVR